MATNKSTEPTPANAEGAEATAPAEVVTPVEAAPAETTVAETAPVRRAPAKRAPAKTTETVAPATDAAPETVPVEAVPVTVEPITASSDPETTVLAETTPEHHPVQEVIVVDAPVAPRKRSNRLVGIAFALLASLVFTVLFAVAVFLIGFVANGRPTIGFLASATFYWPVVLFFLSLVIVIAVVNTAGWWTYIITSVVVAAGVYFGTAAVLLVLSGVLSMSQQEANTVYFAALANPITISAALIAREVAIWTGAILGSRGRKVRARNAEAREAYEREQAELVPTA